jgi:peptidoglycan DL-endopeptidase CwlO
MRITEACARAPRPRPGPGRAPVVAAALLAVVSALVTPVATAEPTEPPVPSRDEVDRSRERVDEAAGDVASVQALLAQADAELEAAAVRAAKAYEAYNGARWELQQATDALEHAREEARDSARRAAQQRRELATLVAASYEGAGELSAVEAVLGAQGPEGVMSQLLSHEGATSSLDADYQRFTATQSLAEVFKQEAEEALERQRAATEAADRARRAAEDAAAAAEASATAIAAEKDRLVGRLAELEGISVELARRRQQALEERARRRAALDAARDAASQPDQVDEPQVPTSRRDPAVDEQPTELEEPSTPPPPPSAPPPAGGAERALAFARAQLGEPYVWGAAGPSSWDCSGLTMRAWEAAGVALPHYSVAQYDAATPISAGQLRPGDLVFWGSGSEPSSIFHVALYLGDGQVIHAPRTGRPVSVDSMYYWVPPNFFGRV